MTQVFTIAIFGLNTTDLNQLKTQILLCLPSNTSPKWVNIAEDKIDVLFVSDVFFNSVGIQNILKERTKKYLKLTKSNSHLGEVVGDQLFYPFSSSKDLHDWFTQKVLPDVEPTESGLNYKKFYFDEKNKLPVAWKPNATLEDVFAEIFTPRNGYIQLFDANRFIALVDTRTERVWVEESMTRLQLTNSLNQTYATSQMVQEKMEGKVIYDLRAWLWVSLSHSSILQLPKIKLTQNFKLDIWPQFERDMRRRDYLEIAACFSEGANINTVKKHLNLTDEKILNFVGCAKLLQLGQFIESKEVKFSTDTNQIETGQTNKLRSFFGKLRHKLGL